LTPIQIRIAGVPVCSWGRTHLREGLNALGLREVSPVNEEIAK
jgi:hypothetical protein